MSWRGKLLAQGTVDTRPLTAQPCVHQRAHSRAHNLKAPHTQHLLNCNPAETPCSVLLQHQPDSQQHPAAARSPLEIQYPSPHSMVSARVGSRHTKLTGGGGSGVRSTGCLQHTASMQGTHFCHDLHSGLLCMHFAPSRWVKLAAASFGISKQLWAVPA